MMNIPTNQIIWWLEYLLIRDFNGKKLEKTQVKVRLFPVLNIKKKCQDRKIYPHIISVLQKQKFITKLL